MTDRAGAWAGMAASVLWLPGVWLTLGAFASSAAADPRTDYALDCMGCHGAAGAGVPGKVPDMRNSLSVLAGTPAGRRYLVEVPGVAQAPLSNLGLARLLNWMMHNLSGTTVPKSWAFTGAEVSWYRKTPLVEITEIRRRLLAGPPARISSRQ